MNKVKFKRLLSIVMTVVMCFNLISSLTYATSDDVDAEASRSADETTLYLNGEDTTESELVLSYNFTPEAITYTAVQTNPKEIVLVIDRSGSMDESVGDGTSKTRLEAVIDSAISFVTAVEGTEDTTVSLVTYSTYATIYEDGNNQKISMSDDDAVDRLIDEIEDINANGGTNTGDGIRLAKELFSDNSSGDIDQYLIFMTDGESSAFSVESDTFSYSENNTVGYYYKDEDSNGTEAKPNSGFTYYTNTTSDDEDNETTDDWKTVYSGYINEQSSDMIDFDIDESSIRYIKVTGNGYKGYYYDDSYDSIGITEVDIYKNNNKKISVSDSNISASDWYDNYKPSKTNDNNYSSLWYSYNYDGDGEWILYDLEKDRKVDHIDIAFYEGYYRNYNIEIEVISEDNYTGAEDSEDDDSPSYFAYYSSYNDPEGYAKAYAMNIANTLPNNSSSSFDAHFIAFGGDDGVNSLEDVADVGDYYYLETTSSDGLKSIYEELAVEVSASYAMTDVKFEETIPDGFDIVAIYDDYETLDISEDITANDQVITGDIGTIAYELNSAGTQYEADPVTFEVKLQANTEGEYILGDDDSSFFSYISSSDGDTYYKYLDPMTITVNTVASSDAVEVDKNILEITQTGESELASYLVDTDASVTTISMKSFAASRDEIEGVYDVIYIGSGDYNTDSILEYSNEDSTKSERIAAHATSEIMNDITNLKANEIVDGYVNKDQLVILHEDVFAYTDGILYEYFGEFQTTSTDNVAVVDSTDDAVLAMNTYDYLEAPDVSFTSIPTSMLDDSDAVYNADETISFEYTINNESDLSNDLSINFYIDRDFDKQFEDADLTVSERPDGELTYTLPTGYSAPYYWKIDIIDNDTELQTTETGVFFFSDVKPEIKVLQVTKDFSGAQLNDEEDFTTSYLSSDEYEITVDVTDMDGFNSTDGDYSYTTVNGTYDMILFGFRDDYRDNGISDDAIAELKSFYETGQGIMMSHDMLRGEDESPKFVEYFKDIAGQSDDYHMLGANAINSTTSTVMVNEGIITQYPFDLEEDITINKTHNQYYSLDLENEDVVTWYNLTGSNRDEDDSYNHYYTYSINNITFSGTGHTNSDFPDDEQRLFVNTMYRAFFGSNHNPDLTVISPDADTVVTEANDLLIEFVVDDLDLGDDTSDVEVWIEDELFYDNDEFVNGETFSQNYDTFTVDGDIVTVKIIATDDSGASVEEKIDVPVNYSDSITGVTRTFPTEAYVADNSYSADVIEEHDITYTFTGDSKTFTQDDDMEIVLVLNTSATMSDYMNDDGTGGLQTAAKEFIENFEGSENVSIGIVRYYEHAEFLSDLVEMDDTTGLSDLYDEINDLSDISGTNLGEGLRYAHQLLDNGISAEKHIVILSDGYQNVGIIDEITGDELSTWIDTITYNTDLSSDVNDDVENDVITYSNPSATDDTGNYDKIGLRGHEQFSSTDLNSDDLYDRFNLGVNYSLTIADEMVESDVDFSTHMIHFTRVDGSGDDTGAQEINNETAQALGVTTEISDGQYFYVADDADSLVDAFGDVATDIGTSFEFEGIKYTETFPDGVVVTDYPSDLAYDEGTNTLSGELTGISMVDDDEDGYYEVDGSFDITVQYVDGGDQVFDNAQISYTEPYEDTSTKIVAVTEDTVSVDEYFDVDGTRVFTEEGNVDETITSQYTATPFDAVYTFTGSDLKIASEDEIESFNKLSFEELYPANVLINGISYDGVTIDIDMEYSTVDGEYNNFTATSSDGTISIVDTDSDGDSDGVEVDTDDDGAPEFTISDSSGQLLLEADLTEAIEIDKESDPDDSIQYEIDDSFTITLEVEDLSSGTYDFEEADAEAESPDGQTDTIDFGTDSIEIELNTQFAPELL